MRILGIDPGLRITGFGLVEKTGRRLAYVTSGRIRTPDSDLPERIKSILDGLSEVIQRETPDHVAIEKVFVNVNPQSTLLLGQARGAAICAAVGRQLGVKYIVTGKVYTTDEVFKKERRVQYYLFMQVLEVETSAILFQNKAALTKAIL